MFILSLTPGKSFGVLRSLDQSSNVYICSGGNEEVFQAENYNFGTLIPDRPFVRLFLIRSTLQKNFDIMVYFLEEKNKKKFYHVSRNLSGTT